MKAHWIFSSFLALLLAGCGGGEKRMSSATGPGQALREQGTQALLKGQYDRAEKLFPGSYVQIELRLRQIRDALLVPTQAVIPVLKGQTVLVRRNGVVVSVPVKLGLRSASAVQVLSGLSAGDTVLTTGIMQARPGMPISVTVR